jgi:hypothetical protein
VTDDLDDLLRRSLAAEASRIEPADGLRAIRARARVRRRSRWRVPALALAGAAAVVAALVAAPGLLPTLETAPRPAAGATAPGPTLIPGAGVNDLPTVWPYGSRAEGFRDAPADQDAGTYGDLTRPDQVAVRFVGSYLGPRSLTAVSAGAFQAGLRVQVLRDGQPISLVYVARVRVGADAPYVVVDAIAPAGILTLDRTPPAPSAGGFTVWGTVAGEAAPRVELRAPGSPRVLAAATAGLVGPRWAADLSRPDGTRAATLAAWVTGPDGSVRAFAARPLG